MVKTTTSGWYGDSKRHAKAGSSGGKRTVDLYGESFFSKIGKKGGKKSPGNFKHDPQRAKRAGSIGGRTKRK